MKRGAFQPGQPKPPGSGRKKGVPNKKKYKKVAEVLAEHDIDLVNDILLEIGQVDEPKDRAKLKLELLSYCEAKPKAVDPGDASPLDPSDFEHISSETFLELVKPPGAV